MNDILLHNIVRWDKPDHLDLFFDAIYDHKQFMHQVWL